MNTGTVPQPTSQAMAPPLRDAVVTSCCTRVFRFGALALACCLGVLSVLAPLPAAAGGEERVEWTLEDPRRAIVWSEDGGANEPLFIPEVLFQEKDLGQLPLTPQQRRLLNNMIEERRDPPHTVPARLREAECPTAAEPPAAGSMPGVLDLPGFVGTSGVSLVGQIVAVVPGLATWSREALQLAYVRVDQILNVNREILFDIEPPAVEELIGVPFGGATIRIAGFAFCSPMSGQFYAPRDGDWILVVGGPTRRNRRLYSAPSSFRSKTMWCSRSPTRS